MALENKPELSPYWQRITGKAEEILTAKIKEIKDQTVDPEACLLPDDRAKMEDRKLTIEFKQAILDRIRKGDLGGKLLALDTVWCENPLLVFRK